MQILFKYLSFLKKQYNSKSKPLFFGILAMLLLLGLGIGIIADILLGWNFIFNTIRCIIAIYIGFVVFSIVFSVTINRLSKVEWLRELSFNQRVNLSIIVVGLFIILFLTLIHTETVYYTFTAGILFTVMIWAIYYTKPTPDEIEAFYTGLEDQRDKKKAR